MLLFMSISFSVEMSMKKVLKPRDILQIVIPIYCYSDDIILMTVYTLRDNSNNTGLLSDSQILSY